MASGRLAASDIAATTNTSVYTVPATKVASFNLNLLNRGSVSAVVRVALSTLATPTNGEYIEYDAVLPANGVLERGGLALDASKIVVVYSSVANVSAVIWGIEE